MSDIRVDTISAANGTDPVTLTKQSAAKILCNFTMVSTTAIRESLNVSSITDSALGQASLSFTSSMSEPSFLGIYVTNAYGTSGAFDSRISGGLTNRNASSTSAMAYSTAYTDSFYNDFAAFGDLA